MIIEINFIVIFLLIIQFSGLCTDIDKINAHIVLTGDPKQLDPVFASNYAKTLTDEFGYGKSFMEFLFKQQSYQPPYNSKCIVQLKINYRNHPGILNIPNVLFYDNVLESKAEKGS